MPTGLFLQLWQRFQAVRFSWDRRPRNTGLVLSLGRWVVGISIGILFLGLYLHRLTLGISWTDEAYYAIMPISWLRCPPVETGNLSLHQLSGALTYPLVWIYAQFQPNLDGVMLFLRGCYACTCLIPCLFWYDLLRCGLDRPAALLASSLFLAFIPFGLPAPSYNTIVLACVASGLALWGRELLASQPSTWRWYASAGVLAIGCCAYPMAVALVPLLGLVTWFYFPERRSHLIRWLTSWLIATGLLGVVLVQFLGGWSHFAEMLGFTMSLGNTLGAKAKLTLAWKLLQTDPQTIQVLLMAFACGIIGRFLPRYGFGLFWLGLTWLAIQKVRSTEQPWLFTKGHDLVLLWAVAGLPILWGLWKPRDKQDRLLAILVLIGWIGGTLIAWSATNSLFNFPILGLLAVVGTWAWFLQPTHPQGRPWYVVPLAWIGMVCLGITSFYHIYGEERPIADLQGTITSGPFAGLRTSVEIAMFHDQMKQRIQHFTTDDQSLEIIGYRNGLYLLSTCELRSPMPFILEEQWTCKAADRMRDWYANPKHQADWILLDTALTIELNQVQIYQVQQRYQLIEQQGPIQFYQRLSN